MIINRFFHKTFDKTHEDNNFRNFSFKTLRYIEKVIILVEKVENLHFGNRAHRDF